MGKIMKKSRKMLIILLIVLACLGGTVLGISIKYPDLLPYFIDVVNTNKRSYMSDEDFNEYQSDFQAIAEFAMNYEDVHGKSREHYLYIDDSDGIQLYDSDTYKSATLKEEVLTNLTNVNTAFHNSAGVFERINVNEHYVMFKIDNDRFAVVFSREGSKPKSIIGYEDRGYSFYTRKVRDNWYFVTGTSGG
jgi:hypothetical protein